MTASPLFNIFDDCPSLCARSVADVRIEWLSALFAASKSGGAASSRRGGGDDTAARFDEDVAVSRGPKRATASAMLARLLEVSLVCRQRFALLWATCGATPPRPTSEEIALLLPIAIQHVQHLAAPVVGEGDPVAQALAATLLPGVLRALASESSAALVSDAARFVRAAIAAQLVARGVAAPGVESILERLAAPRAQLAAADVAEVERLSVALALLQLAERDGARGVLVARYVAACMRYAKTMLVAFKRSARKSSATALFDRVATLARAALQLSSAAESNGVESVLSNEAVVFAAAIASAAFGANAPVEVACGSLSLLGGVVASGALNAAGIAGVVAALRDTASMQLDQSTRDPHAAAALVELIAQCEAQHAGAAAAALSLNELAASYRGTVSGFDRAVLRLMRTYDAPSAGAAQASARFLRATGWRWGKSVDKASNARARSAEGNQITSHDLDLARLRASAALFGSLPRDVTADFEASIEREGVVECEGEGNTAAAAVAACYDPSFVLPLLKSLWIESTGGKPNLGSFIRGGGVGYLVMAMSSPSEPLRVQAYALIARVYNAMNDAVAAVNAKEREADGDLAAAPSASSALFASDYFKRQHHLVLSALKNALLAPFERLSALLCTFIGEALHVMSQPTHPVFVPLNRFLLSRPSLDLGDLPMFYGMFNSGDAAAFRTQRAWMLRVVLGGLQSEHDHALLARRHAYTIMMGFHDRSVYFMYRHSLCESCSQFDSLPLLYLYVQQLRVGRLHARHGDAHLLPRVRNPCRRGVVAFRLEARAVDARCARRVARRGGAPAHRPHRPRAHDVDGAPHAAQGELKYDTTLWHFVRILLTF